MGELKPRSWVIYFVVSLLYVLFIAYVLYCSDYEQSRLGAIGDTFGGLLSPIVGIFSIVLVYKAYKSQLEQIKEQRDQLVTQITEQRTQLDRQINEQRQQNSLNRISDIIFIQIELTNQITEIQSFELSAYSTEVKKGYPGLYLFLKKLQERSDLVNIYPEGNWRDLELLVDENLDQIISIYDRMASACIVIDNMLERAQLDETVNDELRQLLILSLGNNIKDLTVSFDEYFRIYDNNHDPTRSNNDNRMSQLRQFVSIVYRTFDNTLNS